MASFRAASAFVFGLFFALVAAAGNAPWRAVDSDLPPHAELQQGTLANGLRYCILPNAEPQDRISLRLLVAVGSLHENDDERGLAHFVEHMAFRGTLRHPAGSLTASLQRLGLGLGPDSAAFTFADHTVYHLELPDTKEATLREGLEVFREFAAEVTFDAKLIERERGVVLSELATRDTPSARVADYNLAFLWPASRHVKRRVGGVAAQIRTFTRAQFTAFYDAWYRPERMAIIVVGNVTPKEVARLIEAEFGPMIARGAARAEPPNLETRTARNPDVDIYADPGLGGATLTFEHPIPRPETRDTHATRAARLTQGLAFAMLHQRLQTMAHEAGSSFVVPSAQLAAGVPGWDLAIISVSGKIDDWRKVAADLEREHRRAFQFGFTAGELAMAKAAFTAGYEQSVRTERTWPSSWVASRLATCLVEGIVFTHAETLQRDLAPDLAAVTLDDCARAFRDVWTYAAPHVFISANPSFNITREQIGAMLNENREHEVERRAETAALAFAYADFGPAGSLVREEHVPDLEARLVEFANGVRLNFKTTTFEADTVEVRIRVGEGKLVQPEDQPGLDLLANAAVTSGGLGHHTAQELTALLAGRSINLTFNAGSDACVFTIRCSRRDLRLSLQTVAAFLTDAAFRPEAMRDAEVAFHTMYGSFATSPGGVLSVYALREIAGGDRRFGVPPADELLARKLDEVRAWLDPQFKHGAVEMSIVGDTTWEDARDAVARTLGALGPRDAQRRVATNTKVRPPTRPGELKLFPIDGRIPQCGLAWYWPVPPLQDIREERRCRLLAAVLHDRCRVRLREELGAAYSPMATFTDTDGFPHLTYFTIYAEVPLARMQQAIEIVQREAQSLARRGVSTDEFTRARQPFLRERSDDLRTNAYWGATVLGDVQEHPERLNAARDRASDTAAITAAEISRLAKRCLDPNKSFKYASIPTVQLIFAPSAANSKSAAGPRATAPSAPAPRSP